MFEHMILLITISGITNFETGQRLLEKAVELSTGAVIKQHSFSYSKQF